MSTVDPLARHRWHMKGELCGYCGFPPFVGDEYPEPYTGWGCFICGAQTEAFE